jgi:hypothetical protein
MAALVLEAVEAMKEYTPPRNPSGSPPPSRRKIGNTEPLDRAKNKIEKAPKAVAPNPVRRFLRAGVWFSHPSLDF